ncbi:RPM1-interacting protein 4-like protein [Tanacetum coccineum]
MKEKSTDFVTHTKALGEAQEEEIGPTILEAAKTLSKVTSQSVRKAKSTDKGKRYRRRERSMAKNINTGLDAEDEINTGRVEINTGIKDVNTDSTKVDTGRTSISTSSIILSPKKSQWEGKAQMVEEDIQATHKTTEQIRQEEAGLEEAIRLQAQIDEEVAKQIHLEKMVAKRVKEEQELSKQQLKRKAEVQEAAQFYTEEDWDTIREKLEANTEVVKSLQGECISNDGFAKRMVEMINEKKKLYAEQNAKAKRKLKTEFEKLMKSIESFVPMETKARVKRHGLQLEQETSKKQKIDIKDASITKGKEEVVKEEEAEVPFNNEREAFVKDKVKDASSESEIGVNAIPTATKPPTIVNWKIISQSSQKAAYQIIRRDGSDKIYMGFGAILKDFSRDHLIELYRLVIKKYGANRPGEMYDRVLSGDLKTMFNPPLSDDAIWSLPLQQKIINWSCDEEKKQKTKEGINAANKEEPVRRGPEAGAPGSTLRWSSQNSISMLYKEVVENNLCRVSLGNANMTFDLRPTEDVLLWPGNANMTFDLWPTEDVLQWSGNANMAFDLRPTEDQQQRSHIPKFGSWDADNVPYTTYFENARKDKGSGVMINPNDPEQNPEAFMAYGGGSDDVSNDNIVNDEKNMKHGDKKSTTSIDFNRKGSNSDFSNVQQNYKSDRRKSSKSRERISNFSPPSPSPGPNRPRYGYNRADDIPVREFFFEHNIPSHRSASVPMFGAWDEKDPKSGEGFTVIFQKVKEEKHIAATKFPPIPQQPSYNSNIPKNDTRSTTVYKAKNDRIGNESNGSDILLYNDTVIYSYQI